MGVSLIESKSCKAKIAELWKQGLSGTYCMSLIVRKQVFGFLTSGFAVTEQMMARGLKFCI